MKFRRRIRYIIEYYPTDAAVKMKTQRVNNI
jgi:hypothetical protein